jgi:hypothetical protein
LNANFSDESANATQTSIDTHSDLTTASFDRAAWAAQNTNDAYSD